MSTQSTAPVSDKVRRRWHVVVGDPFAPTIVVDCDDEHRADVLAGMYGRRHDHVEVVHVLHITRAREVQPCPS